MSMCMFKYLKLYLLAYQVFVVVFVVRLSGANYLLLDD